MQTTPSYQPRLNTTTLLPGNTLFLLPGLYFILHTLEELPGFAVWVSRYFGTMTTVSFAWNHIPLMLFVLFASYQAFLKGRHGGWVLLATAAMWQFFLNALFHLSTALLFADYSPGMVTAAVLGLPFTYYFFKRVWQEKRLNARELTGAISLGILFAATAIGVLFLQ
jgi:hypothetical protein